MPFLESSESIPLLSLNSFVFCIFWCFFFPTPKIGQKLNCVMLYGGDLVIFFEGNYELWHLPIARLVPPHGLVIVSKWKNLGKVH